MLLLLDDAANAEQVHPLLPAAPGTLVLITSRHRLAGLDDVQQMNLAVLPKDDAVALFLRIARQPDLAADAPEIAVLAELCGYLPLAIGMLAARLRSHHNRTPGHLISQFTQTDSRLGELRDQDRTVAAAFGMSYRDLTRDQQHLFRLLGARPGTQTDPTAAAALLGADITTARRLLEDLQDYRLIDELTTTSDCYRMHDLIREYASALTDGDPDETDAAIDRLLAYYQDTAPTAVDAQGQEQRAMAWLRAERENLLACRQYAVDRGKDAFVVGLSAGLALLLRLDGPWTDAVVINAHAADTASRLGDRRGQAGALKELGTVRWVTDDYPGATEALEQALSLYQELGDRHGQANAVYRLGSVRYQTGDYPGATDALKQALEASRELGDTRGQANALYMLAAVRTVTGDYPRSIETLEQALSLYEELGDRRGQANVLNDLGIARYYSGDYPRATEAFEQTLGLYQEFGDRRSQAHTLNGLGAVRLKAGNYRGATEAFEQALEIHRGIGDQRGQIEVLNSYAEVSLAVGDLAQARTHRVTALNLAREIGAPRSQAHALEGLGELLLRVGNTSDAATHLREALMIYRRLGIPGAARVEELLTELGSENAEELAVRDAEEPPGPLGPPADETRSAPA